MKHNYYQFLIYLVASFDSQSKAKSNLYPTSTAKMSSVDCSVGMGIAVKTSDDTDSIKEGDNIEMENKHNGNVTKNGATSVSEKQNDQGNAETNNSAKAIKEQQCSGFNETPFSPPTSSFGI